MLDIKLIREQPDLVRAAIKAKRTDDVIEEVLNLDGDRRTIISRVEILKNKRNTVSEEIARIKRSGGNASWENLVCCCRKCNMKKSDKLAHQAGMKLVRAPRRPRYVPYISLTKYLTGRKNEVWRSYLPTFTDLPD